MNMQSITGAENETRNTIQLTRTFEGSVNQETRPIKDPNLQGQRRESNSSNVGSTT